MHPDSKILIAGAQGMVGSALSRQFLKKGYFNLLTPSRKEIDFTEQNQVHNYLAQNTPEVIIVAAAKVGGIYANATYPAEFLYENLMIAANLIHEAHRKNIDRLLYLGSSCIYPKYASQPIVEESLLSGPLEPTNEAYAIGKIAGLKLCAFYAKQYGRKYISAMPTNLYGPNDNYHPENAHVIPALIRRFHEAKEKKEREVAIWGSGKPLREFLFVDDLAKALFFLLHNYNGCMHINIGSDTEVTIYELAKNIAHTVGFEGKIVNDLSKPDGTMRKKTDTSKIYQMGWRPEIGLQEGLKIAYADFLQETSS
jgi:GDP-L-fucose synthase